jgi:hypothetical protein
MNLTRESINVQKKDLIEHAVRLLACAELDNVSDKHAASALAQGYLRAAEMMTDTEDIVYIDLGVRTRYDR